MKHYLRKYAEEETSVAAYLYAGDHTYNIWPGYTRKINIFLDGDVKLLDWPCLSPCMKGQEIG